MNRRVLVGLAVVTLPVALLVSRPVSAHEDGSSHRDGNVYHDRLGGGHIDHEYGRRGKHVDHEYGPDGRHIDHDYTRGRHVDHDYSYGGHVDHDYTYGGHRDRIYRYPRSSWYDRYDPRYGRGFDDGYYRYDPYRYYGSGYFGGHPRHFDTHRRHRHRPWWRYW